MAFKFYPDQKKRPWCCIPAHQCKWTNHIKRHYDCGNISLSMPEFSFWYHTRTIRIHHHHWGSNRPREWYPHGRIMGWNIPPITSWTLTPCGLIPTYFIPSITIRHTSGGCGRKWILNWWIHRWSPHWWINFGRTIQKRGITGDPHHITDTSDIITSNSVWSPITPQKISVRVPCRAQDISGMVHTDLIIMDIPHQKKELTSIIDTKESFSWTKIKVDKLESLIKKLNHSAHIIPPSPYFLTRLWHLLKRGEEMGPTKSPVLV